MSARVLFLTSGVSGCPVRVSATGSPRFPLSLHSSSGTPSLICPIPTPGLLYPRTRGGGRELAQIIFNARACWLNAQAGGSGRFYNTGHFGEPGHVKTAPVRLIWKWRSLHEALGPPTIQPTQRKVESIWKRLLARLAGQESSSGHRVWGHKDRAQIRAWPPTATWLWAFP